MTDKIDLRKPVGRRQFLRAAAGLFGLAGLGLFAATPRHRPDMDRNDGVKNSGNVSDHTARFFTRGNDLAG